MNKPEHMHAADYTTDTITLTSYVSPDVTVTFEPVAPTSKWDTPQVRTTVSLPGGLKVTEVMTRDVVRYRHRKMYEAGWRTENELADDLDGHGYYR